VNEADETEEQQDATAGHWERARAEATPDAEETGTNTTEEAQPAFANARAAMPGMSAAN